MKSIIRPLFLFLHAIGLVTNGGAQAAKKKTAILTLALICAAVYGGFVRTLPVSKAQVTQAPVNKPTDSQMQTILAATTTFLDSLGPDKSQKILLPFTPQKAATAARFAGGMNGRMTFLGEQYGQAVWSNYPVSDVIRPGLQLGTFSTEQRSAAMHLLQTLLSPQGYQKVLEIMGSDQALSEGGTNFASGAATYTLAIFGKPRATAPWMVQFGGHHLGLNITMKGEQGVLTPTLTGAQPALYTANGKTVCVLAQENDKAFDLLNALDESQRKQAILNYRVPDLVLGPGHDDEVIAPEGLKASAMNEKQRAMLLDLIAQWSGIINDVYAKSRTDEIKAGLKETYFAWSGPTTHEPGRNGSSYYRIQGPKLIIEFAPQGVGGDLTMHVHTIYRDPTNNYGRAFTGQ